MCNDLCADVGLTPMLNIFVICQLTSPAFVADVPTSGATDASAVVRYTQPAYSTIVLQVAKPGMRTVVTGVAHVRPSWHLTLTQAGVALRAVLEAANPLSCITNIMSAICFWPEPHLADSATFRSCPWPSTMRSVHQTASLIGKGTCTYP